MSEKEIINDDLIFQSFSKNYIFESNKKEKKKPINEEIEFTFGKNLFLDKLEESSLKAKENKNNFNAITAFNEEAMNIYSKNDNNILESGHFGKSKYDSCKYKNIIEKNNFVKQPLFCIEEKASGKYSKPNLNTKKEENEEFKTLNARLKNIQIRKVKSGVKIVNSTTNKLKKNVSFNQNKVKKLKDEPNHYYKVNNNEINKINNLDRNLNILRRNNPILTRLRKMKNNNYFQNDIISNAINKTNNNFSSSQFIEKEIRAMNNKNNSFIQMSGYNYDNKARKSAPGIFNNNQPKLNINTNININTILKQNSRNSVTSKENKENIPININNFKNNDFLYNHKPININNTIMTCSHRRISQYIPKRISKAKNRFEKIENVIRKSSDNYIKLNDIKYNNSPYDIFLSSQMNFGYGLMKNKIPKTNRNKNNASIVCNKLNSMYNKSIGMVKPKNNPRKMGIIKNNIPNDIFMIKSYFMKDNL